MSHDGAVLVGGGVSGVLWWAWVRLRGRMRPLPVKGACGVAARCGCAAPLTASLLPHAGRAFPGGLRPPGSFGAAPV